MRSLKVLLLLVMSTASQNTEKEWCYTEEACGPSTWVIYGSCNGTRQSPVDIADNSTVWNSTLSNFTFTGYGNSSKLTSIKNLGHTVEVALSEGVTISGGGLSTEYSALAFHFHWGNGSSIRGSEHRLDGKQYPMEMHIVHTKHGMNLTEGKKDPTGIAVLSILIDVSSSAQAQGFVSLTNLLPKVSTAVSSMSLDGSLSIDALLGDLDRTTYYRYLGSLTTPTCDEAVVWTVFKNPILVPPSVIDAFSSQLYTNSSAGDSKVNVVNVFRPPQVLGMRQVQISKAKVADPTTASTTKVTSRGSPSSLCSAVVLALPVVLAFMALLQPAA